MWKEVLETYRCLISCREKLPGAKLEDVFRTETGAVNSIKKEYKWLQEEAAKNGITE